MVDSLLRFSVDFATNYTGRWLDDSRFQVTVGHVSEDAPLPLIGDFTATVIPGGNIRNNPPTSAPTETTSVLLSGGFGPSVVYIVSVVGDDPDDTTGLYNSGDTITITFNRLTNRANMSFGMVNRSEVRLCAI